MKFYSVMNVAELLKVNPETVRRWIRENRLDSIKGAGRQGNRISDGHLQEFLVKNSAFVTPEILTELSNSSTNDNLSNSDEIDLGKNIAAISSLTSVEDVMEAIDEKSIIRLKLLEKVQQIDNEIKFLNDKIKKLDE